jgi:hypothetical protein
VGVLGRIHVLVVVDTMHHSFRIDLHDQDHAHIRACDIHANSNGGSDRKDDAWSLGMKVERKLSEFSAEKQKRNENMKTKTEICRTEMETKFFWRKWKQKRNGIFRWNICGNGSFRFRLIRNFCFMIVLHGQSSRSNM